MRRALFVFALLPAAAGATDDFKLNSAEYFERLGIYSEGHQGGLSTIMHDERIASNGDVRLEASRGQWAPHGSFFWQKTEYVLGHGTLDYLLLVLAADHVLNQ